MSRRIVTLNQIFIENFISEGRHILYMSFASSSVRPKTLFLFDTESETQNGQYFWAVTITSQNHISNGTFFKRRNLVTDDKRTTRTKFPVNIKYFWINFVHRRSISCFSKLVFPKKLKNQKNIYNQLWNRHQNWTLMFRSRYQNPVSVVHQPTTVLAYLFYTTTSNVV